MSGERIKRWMGEHLAALPQRSGSGTSGSHNTLLSSLLPPQPPSWVPKSLGRERKACLHYPCTPPPILLELENYFG